MNNFAKLFARHVPGPFRPYGPGAPHYYESAEAKGGHVSTHYRALRRRGRPAARAFREALALPATYLPGYSDGYGGTGGGAGAPWEAEGTRLRWIENTAAAGFRFVGWADKLDRGIRHNGWFTAPDGWTGETLRGGVWQLPGRKGESRFVPGYAELDGGKETNPGSAALALWDVTAGDSRGGWDPADLGAARDAARLADEIAETVAERERDWREAADAGRKAADDVAEALAEVRALRPVLAALRAAKRRLGWQPGNPLEETGRAALAEALEALETAREARREAWAQCPAAWEAAWRDGYAEAEAGDGAAGWNRFARLEGIESIRGEAGDRVAALLPVAGEAGQ